KPEQRGRRDMLRHAGFQLGRNLRHRRHLDEVEIIEQADPQHAEEGVQPAHDRVARSDPVLEILAIEAEHQDDREYEARTQHGVQISEKLVHGSSPSFVSAAVMDRRRCRRYASDGGAAQACLSATASSGTARPFFSITGTWLKVKRKERAVTP